MTHRDSVGPLSPAAAASRAAARLRTARGINDDGRVSNTLGGVGTNANRNDDDTDGFGWGDDGGDDNAVVTTKTPRRKSKLKPAPSWKWCVNCVRLECG